VDRRQKVFLLTAVILLAIFARFWDITSFPPGLYPDQAANGEDALRILGGELQIFSLRNNGRESMFFYFAALMLWLFGVGVWPLFAATALVGVLTVIFTYLAAARLLGRKVALWAAFFLATNPWHVTLSRNGFRAVTAPLIIALSLWFWARLFQSTTQRSRYFNAVGAGIFSGLVLYTYLAGRAFVIFLFLAGLVFLVRYLRRDSREHLRPFCRPLMLATAAVFLTVLPLLLFSLKHPEVLGARAGHVSIFNPALNKGSPLKALLRMTGKSLLAFVWDGDGNPRHNVPWPHLPYHPGGRHGYAGGGVPFLTALPSALALIGLLVAWQRARWLLLLFVVALLPAVLTAEGMPHGLRLVAAIPAHVFFAGLGAEWLGERGVRKLTGPRGKATLGVMVLLLAMVNAGLDFTLYFGIARNLPLVHYEYRADLTVVSQRINALAHKSPPSPPLYLVLDNFSEMTVKFLTRPSGRPYHLVNPARSHEIALQPGEEMIFTQSTLPDAERYLHLHPEVRVEREAKNRFGETVMLVINRK
jgi:4-amino-4-deoxy-L-arabinose transferase-like glycosyltransferase